MEKVATVDAISNIERPIISSKRKSTKKTEEIPDSSAPETSPNIGEDVAVLSLSQNVDILASRCASEGSSIPNENSSDCTKEINARKKDESSSEVECSSISQMSKCLSEVALSASSSLSNGLAHVTETESNDIEYVSYKSELQMPDIMRLIQKDLSEPYSIYTYRYFIHNWPKLCFLAMYKAECVGAIVCKLDIHRKAVRRGYIAMLAVDQNYRKRQIGSNLVLKAIRAMVADNADEVVLETEITNKPALRLYENLGFVRDKRLFRYYLNGVDALRLKLWLR